MKRILVVEDQELNLDLLVQLLEDRYEVATAMDGASGIEMAQRLRPDAILMDLSLPVLDGWEAIRQLKASAELQHIPIVALTAHAMAGDEQRAHDCGCDDYLTKPLDERLLFAVLERHLGAENDAPSNLDPDSRR